MPGVYWVSDANIFENTEFSMLSDPPDFYGSHSVSKFMFMIALMDSALWVILASPWKVWFMTELAAAKFTASIGS